MKFQSSTRTLVVSVTDFLTLSSSLLFPVYPVTEDVDYGAITGIHIGQMFDLLLIITGDKKNNSIPRTKTTDNKTLQKYQSCFDIELFTVRSLKDN